MEKRKRIEKLNNKHFDVLNKLEFYKNGELRFYYDYYRLVDENKNPVYNIKKWIIDDLIEHEYIDKKMGNYTINKI